MLSLKGEMRKRDQILPIFKAFREKFGQACTIVVVIALLIAPMIPVIATLDEGLAKFVMVETGEETEERGEKETEEKKEGKEESEFDKLLLSSQSQIDNLSSLDSRNAGHLIVPFEIYQVILTPPPELDV